jgi:hypothetical protein
MKKKLSLFLLALVATMGAWATVTMPTLTTDPANPVLYSIQSYRSYGFVQYGDGTTLTQTLDYSSANTKFYFMPVNGTDYAEGVKIVSNVNGKQISEMEGFADEGTTWYLGESTFAEGAFNISKTSGFNNSTCWDCSAAGGMTTNYWHANTEGSTWKIFGHEELPQFETSTLTNPKWYFIQSGRNGRYLYADGTNAGTTTNNPKTDAYKFAFISTGNNKVQIVSKAGKDAGNNQYLSTAPGLSNTASDFYYYNVARSEDYFSLAYVELSPNSNFGYDGNMRLLHIGNQGNFTSWYGHADVGNWFRVEEVLPLCEVTYTYTYGDHTYTATEIQNIGDPVSLPAAINFPYTNYTFDTQTVPDEASATVNVTVEGFDMPFEASTDYDNATWYFLRGHASTGIYPNNYISFNGSSLVWAAGNGMDDPYQWAFIGNPIDGIKLINKAAGNGKYLTDTESATSMTETATAWVLKEKDETKFGLWSTTRNNYANCANGTVKYWWDFDNGSCFWVEEVPDNYASNVEAEVKPWFDNYGGNFQLKTSVVEANQATYTAALVNCDLATYQQLLGLLDEPDNYVYPSTGFYRIKSIGARAVGESYIAYGKSNGSSYYGLITKAATAANQDATTVFYLNRQSNGKYAMAIQGLNVQAASQSTIVSATSAAAQEYTFIPSSPGYAVMTVNRGQFEFLHESGWTEAGYDFNAVLGWEASAGASQWTVEEVTSLTIPLNGVGGNYYATFCVPFDVTLDDATTAYTLDRGEGTELTMSAITEAVDAGTPVLLVGEHTSANATIGTNYSAAISTGTALTGTYLEIANFDGAANYVLGKDGDNVGFYHWKGTKLNANRAYIAGSGSGVKGFALNFDDDATGINEEIGMKNEASSIYNLAGQRISKMQKGINIMNGKKIVVK